MKSQFVYISYIKTTPAELWRALTTPAILKRWWIGMDSDSDWTMGSAWTMKFPDGRVADAGVVVESTPPKRLVLQWRNEWNPDLKKEGPSLCSYAVEEVEGAVKLTVTHGIDVPNSRLIESVSGAWPMCLSNLKSLLETGDVILKQNPRHT